QSGAAFQSDIHDRPGFIRTESPGRTGRRRMHPYLRRWLIEEEFNFAYCQLATGSRKVGTIRFASSLDHVAGRALAFTAEESFSCRYVSAGVGVESQRI